MKLETIPHTLQGKNFSDDRGLVKFCNDFNPSEAGIKRIYEIHHKEKGFVRCWHGHKVESKYVTVSKGTFRVVLSKIIWEAGKHYLGKEKQTFFLSEDSPSYLFIPVGYYNGFQNITREGIIRFYSTTTLEESKDDDYRRGPDPWEAQIWSLTNYR